MLETTTFGSVVLLLAGAISISCGGGPPGAVAPSGMVGTLAPSTDSAPASSGPTSATPSVATTAPAAAVPAPPPPPEHPFAATSLDATNMIDAAIDARAAQLVKCVEAARPRRKDPHAKILVEVGLDQEGHLLGVKPPKGALADPDLYACAQAALQGANFPRSHAGIITVVKTFEEQAI